MTVSLTEIGKNSSTGSTGSVAITTTAAINAGDLAVVFIGSRGGSGTPTAPTSITDGAGNVYTKAAEATDGNGLSWRSSLWFCQNALALAIGGTVTASWSSGTPANVAAIAATISGMATASAGDGSGQTWTNGATTSPSASLSAPTSNANDVIVAALTVSGGDGDTFTEDGNFTTVDRLNVNPGSSGFALHAAYRIVSATAAYAYAPTLGAAHSYAETISAFKQAAAPSSIAPKAVHLQNMMRAA